MDVGLWHLHNLLWHERGSRPLSTPPPVYVPSPLNLPPYTPAPTPTHQLRDPYIHNININSHNHNYRRYILTFIHVVRVAPYRARGGGSAAVMMSKIFDNWKKQIVETIFWSDLFLENDTNFVKKQTRWHLLLTNFKNLKELYYYRLFILYIFSLLPTPPQRNSCLPPTTLSWIMLSSLQYTLIDLIALKPM